MAEIEKIAIQGTEYDLSDTTARAAVETLDNKIKAQDTYSTEEVDTGRTWINGKKIYSKIFQFTKTVNAEEQLFPIDEMYINNCIGLNILRASTPTLIFNGSYGGSLYYFVGIRPKSKSVQIYSSISSEVQIQAVIEILYTKD